MNKPAITLAAASLLAGAPQPALGQPALGQPALGQPGAAPAAQEMRAVMGSLITAPQSPLVLEEKCDRYIEAINRRRDALEQGDDAPDIANTLVPYDQMIALIGAGQSEFTLYQQVLATQELREAGAQCRVRLASIESAISLSRPIYRKLALIDPESAAPEAGFLLKKVLAAYERGGVALPDEARARVQAINEELSQISTSLARNIAEDQRELRVSREDLAGLPEDFLAARQPGADGLITLTTASTDYRPVMTYAASDDLRRRFSELYAQRAWPANDALLARMFALRHELAGLLGRESFAALVLEDKMLDTPARVEALIAEMAKIARPVAEHDLSRNLAVLRELVPGAERIEYWQTGWLSPKVQARLFDYDPLEARRYFAYDQVRDGVLRLTQDLFGVEIRPWQTPVWHEDVEAYELLDGGKVIGRFYFDNHPRPGKYTHANMIPLYPGVPGHDVPVGALVQNLPRGSHGTGLMEHSQVETLLHEFGHMLHGLFGGTQDWFGLSGISTEWDFVEAPSQMLENWVFDYETLATFAVDEAGQPIPRDLVAKMNRARHFNSGMGDMTQLGYSNVSLQFHQQPVPADLGAATRSWVNEYAMVPLPDYVEMQASFGHLDGYSAIYYTYRWSKVIADDLFTRFEAEGLRNRQTATDYRRAVLDPGGTRPASQLVQAFLGREVSLDAYRAQLARGLE